MTILRTSKRKSHRWATAALLVAVSLMACRGKGSGQPEYIDELAVLSSGPDGLKVWFALHDAAERPTYGAGQPTLEVFPRECTAFGLSCSRGETPLFQVERSVAIADFRWSKVGVGAFERDVLLFAFPRISTSQFTSEAPKSVEIVVALTSAQGQRIETSKTSTVGR